MRHRRRWVARCIITPIAADRSARLVKKVATGWGQSATMHSSAVAHPSCNNVVIPLRHRQLRSGVCCFAKTNDADTNR